MDTKTETDLEVYLSARAMLAGTGVPEDRADAWGRHIAARCRSAARTTRRTGAAFDLDFRVSYWIDVARSEIAAGLNPPVNGGAL